ncbi:glycoside hydrolase family 13 protein [Thorsellia kenyensis]|uniref:Glycoside hydrolase family 13 protein n=1 Tax=Thorsellia kenyensis TaxID=1549888 RepID=A0ABV6CD63_9GAMM
MITKSSIIHLCKSQMAYAYDKKTLHIRIRTAKYEAEKVTLWIGDPYKWEGGGLGGNLEGANSTAVWIGGNKISMRLEGRTELHDVWIAEFVPPHKRARYGFIIEGTENNERIFFGEKHFVDIVTPADEKRALMEFSNLFCFPFLNPIDVLSPPTWCKSAIWYQIFPERFANGRPEISPIGVKPWGTPPTMTNFMGGDLFGIIDKLDYIQDIGFTGIYLCPIFTAKANHKYDTIDYFNVDPAFGGNEALKALVSEAHKRGIKIMLDAVFNHSGALFPKWLDVVEKGEQSEYKDWFWIKEFPVYPDKPRSEWDYWDLPYETFSNVAEMPKLNTENAACRQYLLDIGTYWVREFDIDGWRLDVSNEVDHHFWRDFRQAVKSIKPDCYILGEIWHDGNAWMKGDQFDALMNYPLTNAINYFIASQTINSAQFRQLVDQNRLNYPRQANEVMFNLLDSHDTDRIISVCQGNKQRAMLAYILLFLQPGAPCVYYGGEIGLDGAKTEEYEGARKCMPWNENDHDLQLKSLLKKLITLRKNEADFHLQDVTWYPTNNETSVSFSKGKILVYINNADLDVSINLPIEWQNCSVVDLLNDESFTLGKEMVLTGLSAVVLKAY